MDRQISAQPSLYVRRIGVGLGVGTERAAVTTVNIVQPKRYAGLQEIVLPGYTQAFSDTPIYAALKE